jgi:inner membrane protein
MEESSSSSSSSSSFFSFQKAKLLVKGIIIAVVALLLMIPSMFVQGVISERQERQQDAVAEVRSKWADTQTVTGPVLVIPFLRKKTDAVGREEVVRDLAFFLPDHLDIQSTVTPEKKHRGMYDVMLYSSAIQLSGSFPKLPLEKLKLQPSDMLWNEAYACVNISDPRGLKQAIKLNWNNTEQELNPGMPDQVLFTNSFSVPVKIDSSNIESGTRFSSAIKLKGSKKLFFSPVGKQTTVEMNSAWKSPSFGGYQLPDSSEINSNGFKARWETLGHSQPFPQQWKTATYDLETQAFGANLFTEVSGYQQTMRSVKYAILCILLTFAAFFLIEIQNSKSLHPLHYVLVGFALILFYTLLLSFSEYTGFNIAYVIASVATIGLITWFARSLLGSFKLSAVLSVVLVFLYSYVFTVLQLQDYALLVGSIGLFLALAVVMYFSKKFRW